MRSAVEFSLLFAIASAHIQFRDDVPNGMNVPLTIAMGHVSRHGGGNLNLFGKAFRAAGFKWTIALCHADSDGDGITNGHELGDPCCKWKRGALPSRTYGLSHPGDVHGITDAPFPNCNASLAPADVTSDSNAEFWKFYYKSRKDQLAAKTDTVSHFYGTLEKVSNRSNYCGANVPEGGQAIDILRKKSDLPPMCGVCDKCCTAENAASVSKCDKCVSTDCQEDTSTTSCPAPTGTYRGSCQCEHEPGCQLSCTCMDSYHLPVSSVCNLRYCKSQLSADGGVEVALDNIFGILTCPGGGINFCRATSGWGLRTKRLEPPSAYAASSGSIEGRLALIFGSYKQEDFHMGGADKAVANFYASAIVFFFMLAVLLVDSRWMVTKAFSRENLLLTVLSMIYVDIFSGILHVVLDNPFNVTMPLIGPQCESFQTHHDSPTRLLTIPWFGYLSEHHVILALQLCTTMGSPKNRFLRVFNLYGAVGSMVMMASHRWAHMHPSETPTLVSALASCRVLMPVRMHSYHHVTYDINFSIFTGWSNPVLNLMVKVLHHHSPAWVLVLAALLFVPLVLSFEIVRTRLLKHVMNLIPFLQRIPFLEARHKRVVHADVDKII